MEGTAGDGCESIQSAEGHKGPDLWVLVIAIRYILNHIPTALHIVYFW